MECESKTLYTTCADFDMLEGECDITVRYNPCEDEWVCDLDRISEDNSGYIREDCRGEFEGDSEFWSQMR
jgi:hypothetical protein